MDLWSSVYFYVCAAMAVAGALFTIIAPNPIRGAMGLLMMILSIAGLFLALHAQFLAAIQLIVYAGAIVVLFLFVIMLLGPSAQPPHDRKGRFARSIGGGLFALLAIGAMALVIHGGKATVLRDVSADFGSIDQMGRVLFSYGLVPFELSSALLMIAVVGAVAVARGKEISTKPRADEGGPLGPKLSNAATMGTRITTEAAGRQPGVIDARPQGGH
jgi:NADH-quinone oxidoreductase subunit J